jgi:hypothetical protein
MSTLFGSFADEFFYSSRLFLKLDLPLERETVLHFFEQVRKAFPTMKRFSRRNDGCLVLEESPEASQSRRWVRLDGGSLRFGHFNPTEQDELRKLGDVLLEHAPYQLTLSELDFDHLEVVYTFDLEFRGNHDLLLAETLWADHPLGNFLFGRNAHHVLDSQPYLGIALSPNCEMQAYLELKSRTGSYEVRTSNFDNQPLSVILTIRRYWGIGDPEPLLDIHRKMFTHADDLATDFVVPVLVNPLAQAIASRS